MICSFFVWVCLPLDSLQKIVLLIDGSSLFTFFQINPFIFIVVWILLIIIFEFLSTYDEPESFFIYVHESASHIDLKGVSFTE